MSALGRFVRDLPPLFTDEKPVSFDPVQTTFLHKLVRAKALAAPISVAKEDFFRAIVFLDTFAELVAGRPTLLDDVGVIVSDLEARHPYLDPDLGLLVRYAAIHVRNDLGGERFFRKATLRELTKRCELSDATPVSGPAELDLFHEAVGRMVSDCFVTEAVRGRLAEVRTRNELRLALVCDAVLATGEASLPSAEGWPATTLAVLEPFVATFGGESLASYVEAAHRRVEAR